MTGALPLAFLAGALTILSPCVLPVLPFVLAAAASRNRFGALALGAGLVLSFVAIALYVATIGFAAGLDETVFRKAAAVLMIAFGLVLLVPAAQARFASAAGPVAAWAGERVETERRSGSQFVVGALLGAVWSPCVGPTLGAASVLASRGEQLGSVALTLAAFAAGVAVALAAIGWLAGAALARWRGGALALGRYGRAALGLVLVVAGALTLTGLDKRAEAALTEASPQWLIDLVTRY